MRVLFLLIGGWQAASSRYRVLQYLPHLEGSGIDVNATIIPKEIPARWRLFNSMKDYDVIFIQKKLFNPLELAYIRSKSRRLVYDFDDAVMFKESGEKSFNRWLNFRQTVRVCDIVIAGNSYLGEEVKRYSPKVSVLPTVLDTQLYSPVTDVVKDRVTLGWIGSRANLKYLAGIGKVLDKLASMYGNVELKIVSDDFIELDEMPVVRKKWHIEEEAADLQSFDIGLMPLPDDPWTRGKCGFKLLQYMAVGIPVVCSQVGVNSEIVEDGYNGFLACTSEEWFDKLSILIRDPLLRRTMGRRGREIVEDRYSLKAVAPRFIELLKGISKS